MAIYNILKQDGRVDTQVDGVAASAAGLIFMAGKERLVPKSGANLMIHLAETGLFAWGNSKEINAQVAKRINALNAIDAEQRSILAAKTGSKDEDIAKLLEAQTWYSPSAAVAAKLGHGVRQGKGEGGGQGQGEGQGEGRPAVRRLLRADEGHGATRPSRAPRHLTQPKRNRASSMAAPKTKKHENRQRSGRCSRLLCWTRTVVTSWRSKEQCE